MAWFPLLVLIVFGMVSIAFMVQMPKEKPVHNIKRVIRGNPEMVNPEPVVVVEPVEPSTMKTWLSIVSVCIEGKRFNKDFIHASMTNKQKWCEHNNIPCFLYDEKHYEHHPKWDKLTRVIDILERSETVWVLWMDCDAVFSNFTISNKEELFDRNYDMITSKDNNGINLGTFLVKNSSIKLLKDMYSMKHIVDIKGGHKDQQALKLIMQKQSVSIKYVPQRYMNSFYMNRNGGQWQQGDWIMHQVDCRRPECSQNFVQMTNKILDTTAIQTCQTVKNKLLTKSIMVPCSKWSNEFTKRARGDGWEAQTRGKINDILTKYQPRSTFQAGMHVGGHLIPMAMAFPKLHFIGVDPDISKCQFVRDMISINSIQNIDIIHGGIDSTQHACAMDKSFKNPGMWTIVNGNSLQCYSIDHLAAEFENIEFIHLDLEGAEYNGILGATETLTKNHPSIIFENDHLKERSQMKDLLISHGYKKSIEVEHNEVWFVPHEKSVNIENYNKYIENLIKKLHASSNRYSVKSNLPNGLTMQSKKALMLLKEKIESIVDTNTIGDIYETGTWRAGTSIFMVAVFKMYSRLKGNSLNRHFYFFDSFEGFRPQGIDESLDTYLSKKYYVAPLDVVRESFKDFGLHDDDHIHFIKGFFEETVPDFQVPGTIALLRLDGDLYSSTKVVLDYFYEHVVKSGWVIIDDYLWKPKMANSKLCKEATDEFRQERGITSPLIHMTEQKYAWQVYKQN